VIAAFWPVILEVSSSEIINVGEPTSFPMTTLRPLVPSVAPTASACLRFAVEPDDRGSRNEFQFRLGD
jgi:hypothetical protein